MANHSSPFRNIPKLLGLPGSPVVETPCFSCRAVSSTLDWGTKIPTCHPEWKKKKKRNIARFLLFINIVTKMIIGKIM